MYQKKFLLAFLFVLSFNLIVSSFVNAKTYSEITSSSEKAYWISGSILITPVYFPVKCFYTGAGLLASGVVLIGSAGFAHDTALSMAKASIGGDWYIHPDYIMGNRKLHFFEPAIPPVASSMPIVVPPAAAPSVAPTPAPVPTPEAVPAPQAPAPAFVAPVPTPETAPTPAPEATTPAPQAPAPAPETAPTK